MINGLQSERLGVWLRVAVSALALAVIVPATPAAAQLGDEFPLESQLPNRLAPNGPSGLGTPLAVEVKLSTARGHDTVGRYNVEGSSSSFENIYDDDLAEAVGDALNIPRNKSDVDTGSSDVTAENGYDASIAVDGRLARQVGDDWVYELDTAALRRVARTWDYEAVRVAVCTTLPTTDQSTPTPEKVEDGCRTWTARADAASVATSPLSIKVTQSPEPENYWTLVAILAGVTVLIALLFSVLTRVLRRGVFARLGGATVATIIALTTFGATAWVIASVVLWAFHRPVDDVILASDLGGGGAYMAHVLPGLLFALPFIGPAIVLTFAKPPEVKAAPATGMPPSQPAPQPQPTGPAPVPGMPSWVNATPEQSAPQAPVAEPPPAAPEVPNDDGDPPPSWHAPH